VTPPGDQQKLSVRQAAARAGVSRRTIERAIERGDLVAYRPGGQAKLVLTVDDVDAWAFVPAHGEPRNERPAPAAAPAPRSRAGGQRGSVTRLRAIERGEG